MNNRFTELVGCELPIQLAAMSRIVTPRLAAGVSNLGGLGSYGAHHLARIGLEVHGDAHHVERPGAQSGDRLHLGPSASSS